MIIRDKRLKGLENEIKRINKNYKKLIDDVARISYFLGSQYTKARIKDDKELANKIKRLMKKFI